jgi:pimeloyl-ACP methyl ester carboxylesterase
MTTRTKAVTCGLRAGAFRARALMTAAAAMLEAVAAFLPFTALEAASSRLLRLPAGDERGQTIDIAIVALRLRLRRLLLLRTILAELRIARIRLLARGVGLLLLRLRRETWLGAERRELAIVLVARIVATFGIRALLLILLRLTLPELFLCGRDDAEVVFRVLIVVLGGHRIARTLGVARQLHVFLSKMRSGAADLDLRTIGFIDPGHRILAASIVVTAVAVTAPAIPHTLVLAVSHVVLSQPRIVALNLQSLKTAVLFERELFATTSRTHIGTLLQPRTFQRTPVVSLIVKASS